MSTPCASCHTPISGKRHTYCSDRCAKQMRQRRWRNTHPEYREHENASRVSFVTTPELKRAVDLYAVEQNMTRPIAIRSLIAAGLQAHP